MGRSAVPVKAQRRRVVAQLAVGGVEDDLREMLHGLARVQLATGGEDGCDVDALGVSLEHAVGEEQDPVARLERQRLNAILVAAGDAERRVGRERQGGDATLAPAPPRREPRLYGLSAPLNQVDPGEL